MIIFSYKSFMVNYKNKKNYIFRITVSFRIYHVRGLSYGVFKLSFLGLYIIIIQSDEKS